jgi:hypothetical protein
VAILLIVITLPSSCGYACIVYCVQWIPGSICFTFLCQQSRRNEPQTPAFCPSRDRQTVLFSSFCPYGNLTRFSLTHKRDTFEKVYAVLFMTGEQMGSFLHCDERFTGFRLLNYYVPHLNSCVHSSMCI